MRWTATSNYQKKKKEKEFGYILFEKLPPAQVETCEEVWINKVTQDRVTLKLQDPIQQNIEINLPLTKSEIEGTTGARPQSKLSQKNFGLKANSIKTPFTMENDILKRILNGQWITVKNL